MKFFTPSLLAISAICLSFPVSSIAQDISNEIDIVIGTYTRESSEGVYTSKLNLSSGKLSPTKLAFKAKDPTYLAVSRNKVIYGALREGNGVLASMTPNETNTFTLQDQQKIHGEAPCYISLSPNEKYIASANYNSANVSIFKISSSGDIKNSPYIIKHSGSSINIARQQSAHPHWVQWSPFNEEFLYVIDLGTDKVMLYDFDYNTGEAQNARVAFNSIKGSGPRHLAFHPHKPMAYILNELSNTIDAVNIKSDGTFVLINQQSTLPEEYIKHNQGAHISINKAGDILYASNRGLNSIAIFDINEKGEAKLRENVPTGGNWPRFFKLFDDHGYMLVANKNSNNIVVFKVSKEGSLKQTNHQLKIDQASYIEEY